jgi:hypothetical protein
MAAPDASCTVPSIPLVNWAFAATPPNKKDCAIEAPEFGIHVILNGLPMNSIAYQKEP